jgi:hypothetical protein
MVLNRNFIFLFTLISVKFSFCQKNFEGTWTDGDQLFYSLPAEGKMIQFEGGNLHEGGSNFYGQILSETKMKVLGGMPNENEFPGYGETNWTLEYKDINNFDILILRDTANTFKGFLLKIPNSENLESVVIKNKINFQLAGKYAVAGSKDSIIFFPNKKSINWFGKNENFEFETSYDFPVDVITIEKKHYYYERKFSTLCLYEAKKNDDEDFEKGKLLYKLILTKNSQPCSENIPGEYGFASVIPLTVDIVSFYSLEELKILRNEIFARHGYIFTNSELKKYFESNNWYKPISTDVYERLSDIERLNLEQIKLIQTENKSSK